MTVADFGIDAPKPILHRHAEKHCDPREQCAVQDLLLMETKYSSTMGWNTHFLMDPETSSG